MSRQPEDYAIYYVDADLEAKALSSGRALEDVDPADLEGRHDADTLKQARAIRAQLERSGQGGAVRIYRRVGIHDTTPAELPPGTYWDWDEELVED